MKMSNKSFGLWIFAGIVCLAAIAVVTAQEKPVTDVCLGCICEASSGCNQTSFCQGGVCGLFRITWPYWADGGKLTINNEAAESETEVPVTDACMGCICDFLTGCNHDYFCQYGVCGPFLITFPYWNEAGRLKVKNETGDAETAFANCANDAYCAANTVQNYMIRYKQDCNADGVVDCYDYSALHKLGGYGCRGDLPYKYVTSIEKCIKSYGES